MRVIVSGAIANKPLNGGEAWVRLSWLLGLRKLGCEVHFMEQIHRDTCIDAAGRPSTFASSLNLAYFRQVVAAFGLEDQATLMLDEGQEIHGTKYDDLVSLLESADLLVNISGHLTNRSLLRRARLKAFIDIDPGFTQYWHAAGMAGANVDGHDVFFTIGENIGTAACPIPTNGVTWRPIRQPVVLDDWPIAHGATRCERFTTVANWRGTYGRLEYGGRSFGQKAHEFRKFIDLPRLASPTFEIALDIHPADARDRESLLSHGWRLVDPRAASRDPFAFRRYIQESDAEFSVAQGVYVETMCGWVSDRTIRYLASGRPALVQDTGFTRLCPIGEGLVPFRTIDEAVNGARRIQSDYGLHSRTARRIAEQYFDSDRILGDFLAELGVA